MREGHTALGYVRTSGDDESDPLTSADWQVGAINAYAELRGLHVQEILVDADVPGAMPHEARPAASELERRVHSPRIHAVLVTRLDRLFSSTRECLLTVARWRDAGAIVHVLSIAGEPTRLDSPQGELLLALLAEAASMEEQAGDGASLLKTLHKRKRGSKLRLGEKVVRGYVVPDPVEAHAVRRIQQLSDQGKSLRLIAEALDQEGVPTKRRASGWSKEAIRLILKRIEEGQVPNLRADASVDA
ncbi:MAG: recombinase family protein [Planctomycetes bacterium]|nr:recombinase family protein [Planctomycetota bacterium]